MTEVTNVVEICLSIVHNEWDDALGSSCTLRTKKDAISAAIEEITRILEEDIPEGKACSLVIGNK